MTRAPRILLCYPLEFGAVFLYRGSGKTIGVADPVGWCDLIQIIRLFWLGQQGLWMACGEEISRTN